MSTLRLGIIGCGFVGGSVEKGFNIDVKRFIVDPKHKDGIDLAELVIAEPSITFLCVPTPQEESHQDVDTSIVRDTLAKLEALEYNTFVFLV